MLPIASEKAFAASLYWPEANKALALFTRGRRPGGNNAEPVSVEASGLAAQQTGIRRSATRGSRDMSRRSIYSR